MRFKAFLMLIVLLLSITFSVSMVSATLSVRNIVSSSGISYRAANDTIGVNVSSTSNVSMNGILCTKQSTTSYICTSTDVVNSAKAVYQLTNTEGDTGVASINVDNNIGSISYTLTNNQHSISLDYTVQDLGFNNNNACSGIKSLSVYDGESVLNTIDINGTLGTCMYTGSINLSISDSGTKSISLEAIDNVGNNRRSPSQNMTLDLSAPEILNGLVVTYAGQDNELSVIGTSASLLADIYFSIQEDNLASITLDLSSANTNPAIQLAYKNVQLPLSNCAVNTTTGSKIYDCYIKSVPLKFVGDTLNINVTAIDNYNNSASTILSKSFTIDNVLPQVSITTDKCDKTGRCYIQNGLNNIIITTNKENFNNKLLFFNIPGSTFGVNKVQNCNGTICTASIPLTCESGSMIDVSITGFSGVASQDDAGNIVAPYTTYLYCDNNPPIIGDINVSGDASSIIQQFVSGSTLTVTAAVKETESIELAALLWTDKAKNSTETGTCTKTSNYDFICTWTVSDINEGYYDANILVNVTDTANNSAVKPYTFKVFGYKSDNETPDFLAISLKKVYPEEINRIVVDMATSNKLPYYVYAQYDLSILKGINVEALHQQVDVSNCIYKGTLGATSAGAVFSEVTISNPYGGIKDVGRIDLKFNDNTDPNILDDDFIVSCNISVLEKEGKDVNGNPTIYKNPQELQLDIPFKLVNTKLCNVGQDCTPGVVLGDKIEKEENNVLVRAQILGIVDNLMPKLQKICSLRNTVSTANNGALIMSMVASGLSLSSGNVKVGNIPFSLVLRLTNLDACLAGPSSITSTNSNSMAASSYVNANMNLGNNADKTQVLSGLANALNGNNQEQRLKIANACKGIVGKACDFLTCTYSTAMGANGPKNLITDGYNADTSAKIPDLFSGKDSFIDESKKVLEKNVDVPDVSNSIIMAAKTGCWPAVIYNADKWRQTECAYLYCIKVASYTGTDISVCDKAKFAQQCSLVVGEFAQSIPLAREVTSYMQNFKDYVSNFMPLASASLLKKVMCPNDANINPNNDPTKVFATGQLPKTVTDQQFRIYACQLPLQIARFADSQFRSKQKVSFRYPEDQDMCALAKCVGEENCKYEPGLWETINQVDLPNPNKDGTKAINTNANKIVAESNALKQEYVDLAASERLKTLITTHQNPNGPKLWTDADEQNRLNLIKTIQSSGQNSNWLEGVGNPTDTKAFVVQQVAQNPASINRYLNSADQQSWTALQPKLDASNKYFASTKITVDEDGNVVAGSGEAVTSEQVAEFKQQQTIRDDLNAQQAKLLTSASNNYVATKITDDMSYINQCQAASVSGANIKDCLSRTGTTAAIIDQSSIEKLKIDTKNGIGSITVKTADGEKQVAYKDLTLDQQQDINNFQLNTYNRLAAYTVQLSTTAPIAGTIVDVPDSNGILVKKDYFSAMKDFADLSNTMSLCNPACDDKSMTFVRDATTGKVTLYSVSSDSKTPIDLQSKIAENRAAIDKNLQILNKDLRAYKTSDAIGSGIYMAFQYLNSQNMMKWFFTDTLLEKITGGKNLGQFLDFNKYVQSWCNPNNPINLDGQSDSGSVVDCGSGICQPVLTYAAERTALQYPNGTTYNVYTATYYISGGDIRARNITYNIYFRGDTPELKGFRDDVQLNAFEIVQKKTAFETPKNYNQICIEFNHPFPPDNALENALSYCRPITENAFNTGSPWTPEENTTASINDSVYTKEYDANGNRVLVSGSSTDNRPPGVFE